MEYRERSSARPKGREDEIAELVALLERPGAAIVLAGEPGIGKTCVLRRSIELAGTPALEWSGESADLPVWANPTSRPIPPTPERVTARTFGAFLDETALDGPFVLVVDDADRLGAEATGLLSGLLRRARTAQWSIAVVGRRLDLGFGDDLTRLELGPLPARLMETRFATRRRDTTDRSILEAAHGNVAAMNCLVSIEESVNRPDDLSFLSALVDHRLRIDPLGDLAGYASLAHGAFTLDLAAQVLEATPEAVAEALGNPRHAPLVRLEPTDGRIVSAHPAIAGVIAALIPDDERLRLHRTLADAFAAMPDELMLIPAARHLAATDAPDPVKVELYIQASRIIERSGRVAEALALLDEFADSIEHPVSRSGIERRRGWLLGRLGRMKEARRVLRRAVELLGDDPDWEALALAVIVWTALEPNPAAVDPYLAVAVRRAARGIDQANATMAICLESARILIDAAEQPRAIAEAEALLARIDEIDHPDALAIVIRQLGSVVASQRRIDGLVELVEPLTRPSASPFAVQATAHVKALHALARGTRGDLERVIDDWGSSLARSPVASWATELDVLRAVVALDDADPHALVAALDRLISDHGDLDLPAYVAIGVQFVWRFHTGDSLGIALPPVRGDQPASVRSLLLTGMTLIDAIGGDLAACDRLQEQIPGLLADGDDFSWVMRQAMVAWVAGSMADQRAAGEAARSLLPHLDEYVMVGCCFPLGPVGFFIAEALRKAGDTEAALCAARAAVDAARRRRSIPWLARSLVLLADVAEATGAGIDPAAPRAEAEAIAERFGLAPVLRRLRSTPPPRAGVHRDELIAHLLVSGRSNREIAAETGLSVKSVERILSQLYRRLGVANRHDAVRSLRSSLAPTG